MMLTSVPLALVIGAPVTVGFAQASYTVAEGGTVEVAVSLSAAHQGVRGITVPVVAAAATTAEAHEFSVPASVTFAAGERTKRFTLTVNQDASTMTTNSCNSGWRAARRRQRRRHVRDAGRHHRRRRSPGYGQLRLDHLRRGRGSSVSVVVNLDDDPERTIAIPITVGQPGRRFQRRLRRRSVDRDVQQGETTKDFTLTAAQDSVDDDDEGLKLGFGMLPARVSAGARTRPRCRSRMTTFPRSP